MALGACHPYIEHHLLTQRHAFPILRVHLHMLAKTVSTRAPVVSCAMCGVECVGRPSRPSGAGAKLLQPCAVRSVFCCTSNSVLCVTCRQTQTFAHWRVCVIASFQLRHSSRGQIQWAEALWRTWGRAPRSLHLLNPCSSSLSFTIKAPCSSIHSSNSSSKQCICEYPDQSEPPPPAPPCLLQRSLMLCLILATQACCTISLHPDT